MLAYELDKKSWRDFVELNVIVVDLSSRSYDVSLIWIDGGIFEILAIAGDAQFGGEDFNQKLLEHFVNEFK